LSEFRNRLFLITALEATSRTAEARTERAAIDKLVAKLALSPDWFARLARVATRNGRIADARRYLSAMHRWAGNATADAGINRDVAADGAYVAAAEAEVALAERRSARALERSEAAHLYLKDPETLATLAASYAAAGRVADAIARYEELLTRAPLGFEPQHMWFETHLALGRLYEQQQRSQEALRLYESLADRWKDADADLVLFRDLHTRLAALRAPR
jgi:tetratricopeptide (TPR) repeat protein